MKPLLFTLPGYGGSGPEHWQSLWENEEDNIRRIHQRDWEHPLCSEWVSTLEESVAATDGNVVLVAHSLACLQVAHWAAQTRCSVRGALLVAPPDPLGPDFPEEIEGFAPVPLVTFPFPGIVVASANDPYASLPYARQCAEAWACRFVNIGEAGHINVASGYGPWPQGKELLASLM